MNTAQTIICHLAGTNGRRIPEYADPAAALEGLAAHYYAGRTALCDYHARQCLRGREPLSHLLTAHYRAAGYDAVYADMAGLTRACVSVRRLRRLLADIRDCLPPDIRAAGEDCYHPDATREQAAAYLAKVLWLAYLA